MAISKEEIRENLYHGKNEGYSHMLIVCDTFDYEDYPVYVKDGEDISKYIKQYQNPAQMSKIMEIYNYNMNLESQLNEHRAWHIESEVNNKFELEPEIKSYGLNNQIKNSLIDMHIHSCFSDGDYHPTELISMIKKANINTFSITDHDTLEGTKLMQDLILTKDCDMKDFTYISGVECSAHSDTGRMHILGYDIDINNQELNELLERKKFQTYSKMDIIRGMLGRKYGIRLPDEDFYEMFSKRGDTGRTAVALMLVKYGFVSTVDEAFDRYLNDIEDNVKKIIKNPSEEEVINTIKKANGFSSIAHPVTLKLKYSDLREKLIRLKEIGLDAIEIEHINQDQDYRKMLYLLVSELDLLVSGGSDYHGPSIKPDVELGTGKNNNVCIKELSLVNKINERKK